MAMAKDMDTGEYLWNLELWHETLLGEGADAEKGSGEQAAAGSATQLF